MPVVNNDKGKVEVFLASSVHDQFACYVDSYQDIHWQSCREEFSRNWIDQKNILFAYKGVDIKNIQHFFKIFEKILCLNSDIKDFKFTEFKKTYSNGNDNDWCHFISLGDFWVEELLRRQLFTVLLRSSVNFDGTNFDNALFSDDRRYSQNTSNAILRFLSGNYNLQNHIIDHSYKGWVSTFSSNKNSELNVVKNILIKKEKKSIDNYLYDTIFN